MAMKIPNKPFLFTVFGASGDLVKTKIFPSFYELARAKKLPKDYWFIGYARTPMTREEFHASVKKSIIEHVSGADEKVVKDLLAHVWYFSGQYGERHAFQAYHEFVKKTTNKNNLTHIAYFSVPPSVYEDVVRNLAETRSSLQDDIRLVIEKPFGESKESAERLYHFVLQYFRDDQFYLLDHYLGKSAVRSILQLRQANRILSHMMRGSEVANIQITAFEKRGVEDRAGYFDQIGMTKDMVQSHLLQILALVTMSIPVRKDPENLQREKNSILSALECPCDAKNVVIGQYKGYQGRDKKAAHKAETFTALRLLIDREEWFRVPVYIRTGKKLHKKHTFVVLELKKYPFQSEKEEPNRVIIELQPEEKIHITLINKHEDVSAYQQIVTSDSIACAIDGCLPEHATLLKEVMMGEKLHFLSFAEILASWRLIDEVDTIVKSKKVVMHTYPDGSTGPKAQEELPKMDGNAWYDLPLQS